MKKFMADKLDVRVFENRDLMGRAAAEDISACIKNLLQTKEQINMIFAAAPSQNDVLKYLCEDKSIDWSRVNAYHMDEYVGIDPEAPQGFAKFLKNAIFDKLPFASVNTLNSLADAEKEAKRYGQLLIDNPTDIVCMGIGENGHIAFNDPHVAFFNDSEVVKVVDLDDMCRMQQVHDGCFEKIEDVPTHALTLTVPTLANATYKFCVVPAPTKANAVKNTVMGEISEKCPATVLRVSDNSILYCDADSAALI